ncbi:phosphate ABC transporter ATP-binding protein, partial [Staphylococcus cohnii]
MAKDTIKEEKTKIAEHTNQNSVPIASIDRNTDNKEHKIPDSEKKIVYSTKNLDLWYGDNHALKNINLDILENNVTAII